MSRTCVVRYSALSKWPKEKKLVKLFYWVIFFAGLYLELHVWLLSCVCGVCVLIWRPVDSNISTSFVTLKQRGSSFCSNNFAPWKNCSLKMKYIQGSIPLLKHTRNQPRNRKFQEQAVFKPEKQAIVPKINGKRQTISTATTVTSLANILRFICTRRCWFDGSWLQGAMECLRLNPTDFVFTLEWFFFHLVFIQRFIWEVKFSF